MYSARYNNRAGARECHMTIHISRQVNAAPARQVIKIIGWPRRGGEGRGPRDPREISVAIDADDESARAVSRRPLSPSLCGKPFQAVGPPAGRGGGRDP